MVRNGSKNLIGKHASIKEKMDNTVIGAFMTGIRSKDNFYIKALLDSDIFKKEIQKNLGATINQIITGNFKKMVFPFSSQEEEKSIGNLFTKLDETITLLQRKEKKYNDLKKALLQNIFPGNDQIIPILRFKEFNDEWQQSKLGEIMDVGSVKRIHQADWRNEGVRFLRARDIVALSKNEEPTDFLYIDNSKYNEYSKISGKVQKGDLLVTGVGSIGIPMLIRSKNPIYFKDGNIIWFKNHNILDGKFFYYEFNTRTIQSFINRSSGSGTVGTYTIDNGRKTPVTFPFKLEQQKIGNLISKLDETITLLKKQKSTLTNLKKFLLQNMFI